MKAAIYDGSRRIMVDTKRDICLTSGSTVPPASSDVQVFGKDLYLHENPHKSRQFYFHIRPLGMTGKDRVVPVSPVMAEWYLLQRGITCTEFPATNAVLRLYEWGYGIAEEF